MDKEALEKLSTALTMVLDRLGYVLDDEPTPDKVREMIRAYLRTQGPPPSRYEGEAFREALALGRPVMDGGKVYVSLRGLLSFMRRRWRRLTDRRLLKLLREVGARPRSIYVRKGYTALIGKRYWEIPNELIPHPLKKGGGEDTTKLTPDLEAILSGVSLLDFLKALEEHSTN